MVCPFGQGELMIDVNMLKFDKNGLLTGIVQDVNTGGVLMVAMMNPGSGRKNYPNRESTLLVSKPKKVMAKRGIIRQFYACAADKSRLRYGCAFDGGGAAGACLPHR